MEASFLKPDEGSSCKTEQAAAGSDLTAGWRQGSVGSQISEIFFHTWCGKKTESSLFSWGKPRGKAADPVRFPPKSLWKVDRKKDQRNLKKSVDICSHIWYYSQALQGELRAHRTAHGLYESSSRWELQKVWKTWKKFLTDKTFCGIINESTARCGVHLVN